MEAMMNNKMQDLHTISKLLIIISFLVYGFLIGCLVLAGLLQLVAWPAVLLVLKTTLIELLLGIACGMLAKCFLGRKKGVVSNLLGTILITPFLLAVVMAMSVFHNASLVGKFGGAIGIASSLFCLAAAAELGRNIANRVQRPRQ
jgi:hypothetical protein